MFSPACAKNDIHFGDFLRLLRYRVDFSRKNPDYFSPDGLIVFTGPQGSGKTLSAVNYICNLMELYPKAILVTNVAIADYPIVTFDDFLRQNYRRMLYENLSDISVDTKALLYSDYLRLNRVFPFNDADDLITYSNLDEGVIFFIDEVQLYFNSLESKNINMDVMAQISQQRKQRKHIVCTSQVFGRLAKPLREQFNAVVQCRCYLNSIQINKFLDNEDIQMSADGQHFTSKVVHTQIFIHKPSMYSRYDTSYIIEKGKFIAPEGGSIYGNE